MLRKCKHCKECVDFYEFHNGLRIYHCPICNIFYKLVLGKGLVEIKEPPEVKGFHNVLSKE